MFYPKRFTTFMKKAYEKIIYIIYFININKFI